MSCHSPSLQWLLAILGVSWSVDTSLKSLTLSSYAIFSVYLSVTSSLLTRTLVTAFRTHPKPRMISSQDP